MVLEDVILYAVATDLDALVAVDVVTGSKIERPRDEVAAFAPDPDDATRWYVNIAPLSGEPG